MGRKRTLDGRSAERTGDRFKARQFRSKDGGSAWPACFLAAADTLAEDWRRVLADLAPKPADVPAAPGGAAD
jgi:hypothetical protein